MTRLVEALVAGDEVAVPQQSDGHLRGQLEAVFTPLFPATPHKARVVRGHQDVLERCWRRLVRRLQRVRPKRYFRQVMPCALLLTRRGWIPARTRVEQWVQVGMVTKDIATEGAGVISEFMHGSPGEVEA